jgi:hypothetical protein
MPDPEPVRHPGSSKHDTATKIEMVSARVFCITEYYKQTLPPSIGGNGGRLRERSRRGAPLLLPGSLLMTIGFELLAALVFVDLRFTTFFQ